MNACSALDGNLALRIEDDMTCVFTCMGGYVRGFTILCLCVVLGSCASGASDDDASAQLSASDNGQGTDGTDPYSEACSPATCEEKGADCGIIADGCASTLNCGACPDGQECGSLDTKNRCLPPGCLPLTCERAGAECGLLDDGCGQEIDCGICVQGGYCGGSGVPNICSDTPCIPKTCEETGAECGAFDDGCDNTLECGDCPANSICGSEEANRCGCVQSCQEAQVECGTVENACNGPLECGGCADDHFCIDNTCIDCMPQCEDKECGDDGCGGQCGVCEGTTICIGDQCVTPHCAGKCDDTKPQWCGWDCKCHCNADCFYYDDCCEDVCISCATKYADICCLPACGAKECGDDGCGGSCGTCSANSFCEEGFCEICELDCTGKDCGPDGCGGSCGTCDIGDECDASLCVPCEPKCEGKQCGDDGCGGVCGNCEEGMGCDGEQQCVPCVPDCTGKLCGDNGCGGSCGDCGVDCNTIAPGPFVLAPMDGPIASEDLAFDKEGNLIGANDKAIFKSTYDGDAEVWVPNLDFRAGLRYLPTGDLMVNNDNTGQLLRIEEDGTVYVTLSGLSYPNGMTVDMKGYVYVTEHDAKRVLRVEPYEQTVDVISEGVISNPNGIAFNVDYSRLYVAGFSGVGTIYAFDVDENGDFGDIFSWKTGIGTGWLDGIGVDICGNVYIADYTATKVFRITPDGSGLTTILEGQPGTNTYLPNMQWGSGIGGWKNDHLYLPDGWNKGVFEVDIGVPGPPHPFP
jgi:sugar lactone lactonase YvrE